MQAKLKQLAALIFTMHIFSVWALPAHTENAAETEALVKEEKNKQDIYKAVFPDIATARRAAITFHSNLLEAEYEKGYLIFELSPDEKAKLEKFGFVLSTATEFIEKRNAMLDRVHGPGGTGTLLGKRAATAGAWSTDISPESITNYSCYETVEETFATARGFTTQYPTLATWSTVGQSWEKTAGIGGWDIQVLKLTNSRITGNKPKLFINSSIHAREYTTAPLALAFAKQLLEGYGTNADATWILDHHEIHLMLQTNPDGRKKAETGLLWRKNTNRNYCGRMSNKRGADLNRNFTQSWNVTNGEGSSSSPCNETYRGPSAGSEPEVQAMQAYVRTLWPDRRGSGLTDPAPSDTSGIHIDLHSYSQLVLWPYGTTATTAPNGTAMQTLGRRLAWFNNYTPMQAIGLYPTDGTSDSVSYGELGVAAFTIELGTSFFQSCTSYDSTIKPQNLSALMYAAKVVRTPYLTPAGPDVTTPTLSPNAASTPVTAGTAVTLTASATDSHFNQSGGTEATQAIAAAEYYIDVPPWAGGAARALNPADGSFNSVTESVTGTVSTSGFSVGKHIVYVRAKDASGTWGPISAQFIQIR